MAWPLKARSKRVSVARVRINHDGGRSDGGLECDIQARKRTSIAMKLLGDSMGPVVWDVIGNSCLVRDHVSRQTG
jgi:hypothetical protein